MATMSMTTAARNRAFARALRGSTVQTRGLFISFELLFVVAKDQIMDAGLNFEPKRVKF